MKRQSRIRRVLAFTSTMLGAFIILGVAASLAFADKPEDPGPPVNPNCPEAQGNGCGAGSGNCGSNPGVGSGGVDEGYGNNESCGDEEIDCDAIGGDHELCVDQCPDLQGYQSSTSSCPPVDPDPVDACPNVTGFQQAGPCDTPGSSDTPPPSDDPTPTDTTGGGDQGEQVPAGEVPEAESLTIEDAVEDNPATIGDEEIVAGAAAGGGATDAGATYTPTGSLPYTGGPLELVAALGALLVLFGITGIAIGRRADRRRANAAA